MIVYFHGYLILFRFRHFWTRFKKNTISGSFLWVQHSSLIVDKLFKMLLMDFCVSFCRTILARLDAVGYSLLACHVFIIYYLAPMIQLQAVRILGAPTYATLLPWRLVPALCLGLSPILDETLTVTNFIGVGVVFAGSSFYVWTRYLTFREDQLNDDVLKPLVENSENSHDSDSYESSENSKSSENSQFSEDEVLPKIATDVP